MTAMTVSPLVAFAALALCHQNPAPATVRTSTARLPAPPIRLSPYQPIG
ncbi:hypothetical protein OG455_24615 [Kitasatospora sp. NBC_01287]|nr:hypothetical protein [Kitasatospora sp. NBC_01287]MCX4748662.1 hypothetical protein [Kitasatospora sp. NBC_01287]